MNHGFSLRVNKSVTAEFVEANCLTERTERYYIAENLKEVYCEYESEELCNEALANLRKALGVKPLPIPHLYYDSFIEDLRERKACGEAKGF